jgi:uncharacterized membrane protein YkvI
MAFKTFGTEIEQVFSTSSVSNDWLKSGLLYSGYNLAVSPTVLFAITSHKTRTQTMCVGLLAGLIVILPAILFYVAMMAQYPAIGDQPVPATFLMAAIKTPKQVFHGPGYQKKIK